MSWASTGDFGPRQNNQYKIVWRPKRSFFVMSLVTASIMPSVSNSSHKRATLRTAKSRRE